MRTLSATDMERDARARRAYRNSQKMIREWQNVARVLSRRPDLRVELTWGTPSTDGKNVYIRPPIELGDEVPHDRSLCGRRGEDFIQLCPMCGILEDVTITVIHEVSHIIHDTFEPVALHERSGLLKRAIKLECNGRDDTSRARKLAKRIEESKARDYLNLCAAVSPFMPLLFNAVEDVRVNASMMKARRGTKVMFEAQTNRIFDRGFETANGKQSWKERKPNEQAMIGVYCITGGIPLRGRLTDEIVDKLEDDRLVALCGKIAQARTARQVFGYTFPLLEELRRLGFMLTPDDPEDDPPPPPPEPEPEESDEKDPQEEGDDSDDEAGDSDGGTESGDSPSEDGDTGDGEAESEASGDGDGSSDEDESDSNGASGSDADDSDDDDEATGGDDVSDGGSGRGDDSEESPESEADSEGSDADDDGEGDDSESDGGSSSESGDDQGSDTDSGDDSDSMGESGGEGEEADDSDSSSSEMDDSPESGSGEPADGPPDSDDVSDDGATGASGAPDGAATGDGAPATGDATGATAPPSGAPDDDSGAAPDGAESPLKDEAPEPMTWDDVSEMGTPEEVADAFARFGRHDDKAEHTAEERRDMMLDADALRRAMEQADFFDRPSMNVRGVKVREYKDRDEYTSSAWRGHGYGSRSSTEPIEIPHAILAPALQRLRIAFTDNARGSKQTDLRSGKVNARVLARRVPTGDDRLFMKKTEPGKKDYFVLIGLDVSGSTTARMRGTADGCRLDVIKQAAHAKAELLHRLGITFAMYAHTGTGEVGGDYVDIYQIKSDKEPWGPKQKAALAELQPYDANLDGHTLEFYRKVVERRTETDRLILYYTDGAMPMENYDEELAVLQTEIEHCRRRDIKLVGVGVETDSPSAHGLDTIRLDRIEDVPNVVNELRKRLLHG